MPKQSHFAVIDLAELVWPGSLRILTTRFRLFVAANVDDISDEKIYEFAQAALRNGMVYCCVWGKGCERFHDIVDHARDMNETPEHQLVSANNDDVIMTTWHNDETLDEALTFFAQSALPTDGYSVDSEFWLAVCLSNLDWSAQVNTSLQSLLF